MNRVPSWEIILHKALKEYETQSYMIGHCDCFIFSFDVLSRITGEDWFEKVKAPAYKTKTEGIKALKELYSGSMLVMMDSIADRQSPSMSQRGNVVGIDVDGSVALGIYDYPSAKFVTDFGFISVPLREIKYSWDT